MKLRTFIKTLFLGLTILASDSNAIAGDGADGWNGRGLLDGLVVSFCGNNGKFLSSEDGSKPMVANRSAANSQERFTVVSTANFVEIYLLASNGKFVRVVEGSNELKADATSIANATLFVSNDNANAAGQHTLSVSGQFLSSENGARAVRANRSAVGLWELWDVQAY